MHSCALNLFPKSATVSDFNAADRKERQMLDRGKGDMSAELTSWVSKTVERNGRLIPLYARAVEEENLQDLVLLRRQMAEMIEEADRLIVHCLVSNLEKRIHDE